MAFPLSTTLAALLNVAILYALVPRKIGALEGGPLAAYAAKLVLASAAGGGVAWLANRLVAANLGTSLLATVAGVGLSGLAGLAVFFAASRVIGLSEARDYLRRFLRK
jgi:peptidoglycan biosynthesis protein MviN/MurJ (putative lipid II flippase)